jgi:hypothetical protein
MTALEHFDPFPWTHPSVGYLFGYETLAGVTRNGQDASIAGCLEREEQGTAI